MKQALFLVAIGVVMSLAGPASAAGDSDYAITFGDVTLRSGVTVDISATVYVNEGHRCRGNTLMAVHGFAHTGATWGPLAEALFDSDTLRPKICRIVAIDLPGRGSSGLPDGMLFGDLFLDDYVTAVLAVLGRLGEYNLHPRALIAHSQGGLITQMAQQRLGADGETLRSAFNIRQVVLLAPVVPREIGWGFADSGAAVSVLAPFITYDPALGVHIQLPPQVVVPLFYTNLFGIAHADSPSVDTIIGEGYSGPEPLYSALQLVGAAPFVRPSVDAGIFSGDSGSSLHIVAFEHDLLLRPEELSALDDHLMGADARGVIAIDGEDAVHNLYIADSERVAEAIADALHP